MTEITNIALDAMGGDNAPVEVVKGAVDAVNADGRVKVFLTGRESVIKAELQKYTYNAEQMEITVPPVQVGVRVVGIVESITTTVLPKLDDPEGNNGE